MWTREAIIDQWRHATARVDPETARRPDWEQVPAPTFLHAFRPNGARLSELFTGMPDLQPVLDRLRVVFERAGPETGHLYFVVSRPLAASDDEVVAWVRSWLANVRQITAELGLELEEDLGALLGSRLPPVDVRPGPSKPGSAEPAHPAAQAIYEATTELGRSWTFRSPAGPLLVEPCYQLACSYELAYWILTPLALAARGDPFDPAARLWEAGVRIAFEGSGSELRAVAHRGTL